MADEKLTELDAAASVSPDDLLYIVQELDETSDSSSNPTPISKKVSVGSVLGANGLNLVTVVLNNAQIKAAPTSSPVAVDGIPGKTIWPIAGWLKFNWTADYSGFGNQKFFFLGSNSSDLPDFNFKAAADAFLAAGASVLTTQDSPSDAVDWLGGSGLYDLGLEGEPLKAIFFNRFTGSITAATPSGTAPAGSGGPTVVTSADIKSQSSGATGFNISITWTGGAYTISAINHGGSSAEADVIVISGEKFGGIDGDNDLTIAVDTTAAVQYDYTGGDPANTIEVTVLYAAV